MTVIKPVLIRSGSLELHFYIDSVEQQLLKDINELRQGCTLHWGQPKEHWSISLSLSMSFICHALVASFFCPLSSSADFSLLQVRSPIKSWSQVSGIGSWWFFQFLCHCFFQSLPSHSLSALNLVSFSLKRSRIIKYSLETCFPEKVHQMQPLKADKTFNFSHWPKSFTIKWNFKKNLQEFFGRMSSPRLEWRFHQGVRLSFYLIRF